jgi:hypothetical protein
LPRSVPDAHRCIIMNSPPTRPTWTCCGPIRETHWPNSGNGMTRWHVSIAPLRRTRIMHRHDLNAIWLQGGYHRRRNNRQPELQVVSPTTRFFAATRPITQREFVGRCSPSASPSASNFLCHLASVHRSPITTGFAGKPPHCDAPTGTGNSLSRPICLQTSRLRGFSAEVLSG